MAIYKLASFAGVALPIYNVQLEMPAEAPTPIIRTVNGYFDTRGTRRQFPLPASIRMRAVVASYANTVSEAYLLVNGGNRLVVNGGNPLLIVTQGPGQVREQMERFRGLIGVRAALARSALAGEPSAAQTISARLLSVREADGRPYGPGLCALELGWEAVDPFWAGAAGAASGLTLRATVGGNAPVRDATLIVSGTTASTRVTGPGIDFSFVGGGHTLIVSGWGATASLAPTSVTLGSGHTADSLVELAAGTVTTLSVTGASDASLTWNEKWV